jgi:plastocyanin
MSLRLARAAALLLICSGCGSSSNPSTPSPTPSGNGTPVTIVNGASVLSTTAFTPNPVTVTAGGAVTWTNADNTTHNITATNGSFSSGSMAPGRTFTMTLPTAGTIAYRCTIHPQMSGTITVQ